MTDAPDSAAVEVARITARQAVIVALISLLGGIAVALIGSGFLKDTARSTTSQSQRAVRIAGVDLGLDSENRTEQALRILTVVNGSAKAYPTDGAWAPPNPGLSSEPFTVPEAQEYSIRFEVFAKDARVAITRFVAPSAHTIAARRLPAPGLRIQLQEEGSGGHVVGTVKFSIE